MIEHSVQIPNERIVILDFGSQYTQLIARRIRELQVYAEIVPYFYPVDVIKEERPAAIILSGGPSSTYEKNAPQASPEIFNLGIPILGICYGLYQVVEAFRGKTEAARSKEYGRAMIRTQGQSPLFAGLSDREQVWMSHGDKVVTPPPGFTVIASSENAEIAAIECLEKKIY
jgi:GMP synthase (glutamine-hydrolysing)